MFSPRPLLGLVLAACLQAVIHADVTHTAQAEASFWLHDEGLPIQRPFSIGPIGDLNAVSSSGFTTLKHSTFPKYAVRVKKSRFCDGTVE